MDSVYCTTCTVHVIGNFNDLARNQPLDLHNNPIILATVGSLPRNFSYLIFKLIFNLVI